MAVPEAKGQATRKRTQHAGCVLGAGGGGSRLATQAWDFASWAVRVLASQHTHALWPCTWSMRGGAGGAGLPLGHGASLSLSGMVTHVLLSRDLNLEGQMKAPGHFGNYSQQQQCRPKDTRGTAPPWPCHVALPPTQPSCHQLSHCPPPSTLVVCNQEPRWTAGQ